MMAALRLFTTIFLAAVMLLVTSPVLANPCTLASGQSPEEGIGGSGLYPGGVRDEGLGGTGHAGFSEGIGGTGHSEGMGGTGMPLLAEHGSLMVYGRVTGFASVCVNGLEVHYTDNTRVLINGAAARLDDLRVGQIVAIQSSFEKGELFARQLDIRHEVIGKITSTGRSGRIVRVAGQTVHIAAQLVAELKSRLVPGMSIKVSGFRDQQNEIIATRLAPELANARVVVTGPATRVNASSFRIAGLTLPVPKTGLPASPEVRVSAVQTDQGLQVLQLEPLLQHLDSDLASIQGIVERSDAAHIKLTGWPEMPLSGRSRPATVIAPGELVHMITNEGERGAVVERMHVMTESELFQRAGRVDFSAIRPEPGATTTRDNESESKQSGGRNLPQRDADPEKPDGRNALSPAENHTAEPESRHDAGHRDGYRREPAEYDLPELPGSDRHEVPEVEMPEIETPEVETPEVEAPEIETPEVEAPEIEVPEIETPEVEAPEVEVPEVEVPEVEVPEVETPEIEAPEIEAPEIEAPEIEAPEIEVPEVEEPEFEAPELPETDEYEGRD